MQNFLVCFFPARALAVVGVLVLALLVWFVGPLVSFDTLRPLASVGSRVVTIACCFDALAGAWLVGFGRWYHRRCLCGDYGCVHRCWPRACPSVCAAVGPRPLIGFILLMYALYGLCTGCGVRAAYG